MGRSEPRLQTEPGMAFGVGVPLMGQRTQDRTTAAIETAVLTATGDALNRGLYNYFPHSCLISGAATAPQIDRFREVHNVSGRQRLPAGEPRNAGQRRTRRRATLQARIRPVLASW
jgi:hypothetical protein